MHLGTTLATGTVAKDSRQRKVIGEMHLAAQTGNEKVECDLPSHRSWSTGQPGRPVVWSIVLQMRGERARRTKGSRAIWARVAFCVMRRLLAQCAGASSARETFYTVVLTAGV